MISLDDDKRPGLYVHVPFCVSRCPYCAFASDTELGLREVFLSGLEREVALRGSAWRAFDTVYLGGGTPSALGLAGLERLLCALEALDVCDGASWTVEINPDDADPELLRGLRAGGVQRLSLGVQSLDDRVLRYLGRRHDAQAARQAVEMAKRAGFEDIGLDLMYALPGQSVRHWLVQLEQALALEPTHLSCYELTTEEGTPFGLAVARGGVKPAGDDRRRDLFLAGSRALRDRGWDHYEVSNFARSRNLRAQHNQKYWRHVPYLGLGPAAHSFDGLHRWWNREGVRSWSGLLERGESPTKEQELLDAAAMRLERLALGFRHHAGVALSDLQGDPHGLKQALIDGLLVQRGPRVYPTPLGFLVADGLALRFV